MKITFSISESLKKLSKQFENKRTLLRRGIKKNAEEACKVMVRVAAAHTPNSEDGKKRGVNVISNSLQNSWSAKYTTNIGNDVFGSVSLTNSKPYAKFVQYGHDVKKHFVPWLYKDSNGTLSYETNHSQKMFGLMVGTKTKHVDGVDMVSEAIDAFNECFDKSNRELIEKIFNMK